MKADRFMRANGRKNLWLLRNTNQIYDNAVKSYYERSNSLLPYNPATQHAKEREEHQAPLRTLTTSQRVGRTSTTDYPRNHKEMAEQAANANAHNLLNTVMQANRRRSLSFSAGGMRMYGRNRGFFGSSPTSSSTILETGNKRERNRQTTATEAAQMELDHFDVSVFRGRSMSLPARTTLELGMGYVMGRQRESSREPQPSCRHHLNTIERTRRQQEKSNNNSDDSDDQLMIVDEALKQRLAVKFDKPSQPGLFGGGGFVDSRRLTSRAPSSFDGAREQLRFHTLGERIKRFEVMQFADGPVKFQAFDRRQDLGSGRTQHQLSIKHLPKQEASLSIRNMLHRNHRQRALNNISMKQPETQEQQPEPKAMLMMMKRKVIQAEKNVMPLGPLGPLAPNWRPQQQQQQQQQQHQQHHQEKPYTKKPLDAFSPPPKHNKTLKNSNSKMSVRSSKAFNKADSKTTISPLREPTAAVSATARTSHLTYMRDSNASRRQHLLPRRLAEQLQPEHKVKAHQKQSLKLPEQPPSLKGVNQLLAASASQVSAHKREYKSRQQILQAEMLHMHAQQESVQRQKQQQQQQKLKQQQVEQKRQQQQQQLQRQQQLQQKKKLQQQQQEQLDQQHQQHLQRKQQLQQQQQQKQQQQQLGYIAKIAKKHPKLQQKSETKPPAKMVQQQQKLQPVQSAPLQNKKKKTQATTKNQQQQQQQPQQQQLEKKKPTGNQQQQQQPQQQSATATIPLPVEASQKRKRLNLPAYKPATAGSGHATAMEHSLSTSFQRLQQQQLHQQLRQRRQPPYESLWRHTY